MTRQRLRGLARLLIGMLLFGQMAIAAYACPAMVIAMDLPQWSAPIDDEAGDAAATLVTEAGEQNVGCSRMSWTMMDPPSAKLCVEHCNYGQQGDHSPVVAVPAVLLNALYVTPTVPEPSLTARAVLAATDASAAASTPHAILHCCFRL